MFLTAVHPPAMDPPLNTMGSHLGSSPVGDCLDQFGLQVCLGGGVVFTDLQAEPSAGFGL